MDPLLHGRRYIRSFMFIMIVLLLATGCSMQSSSGNERIAPPMELVGLEQTILNTADVNKPMVLNFWASWCQYCNVEIPILDSLYEDYKDQVEFVSINITYSDDLSGAKSFIANHQLRMPVYYDIDAMASELFLVQAVPSIVTVDADGLIVTQRTGAIGDLAEEVYREQLDALLSTAQ